MKTSANTIFLHIGAGKTGTTAIQATIPRMRRNLEEAGLRAPLDPAVPSEFEFRPRVGSGYSFSLAKLLNPGFKNSIPLGEEETWKWLEIELDKAQNEGLNLLFSSEALQFAREPQLQAFKELAARHGFQIKAIFYARTAIDYSISEYLQHLKTGFSAYPNKKIPTSLRAYIATAVVPFGTTLSNFSKVFGGQNLDVRNYDVAKSNLLDNFFTAVTGNSQTIPKSGQRNRSLTRNEQEALENLLKCENGSELCKRIGNKLIQAPSPKDANCTYFVDAESMQKFISNNGSIVKVVNGYLPLDQQISVTTGNSPVTTKSSDDYKPDWHSTYRAIIETLV
jgi:hypothetical protein